MSGWIKHFLNGEDEHGSDEDVRNSKASWSRGRLLGMQGASIHYGRFHLSLMGEGEYWQSDDFDTTVLALEEPKMVIRRIMKKIRPGERIFQVLQTEHSTMLKFLDFRFGGSELLLDEKLEVVPSDRTDQWLVLEYDIKKSRVYWYYSEDKI